MQMQCSMTVGILFALAVSVSGRAVTNETGADCECYEYDCGCCEYIDWSQVGLNGLVCTNFSYLPTDYGVSITITWNNYTLFNETISARNPPPICFGIPKLENIDALICARFYDLQFKKGGFHGCGKLSVSVVHIIHKSINLGCINIPSVSRVRVPTNASRAVLDVIEEGVGMLEFWKKLPAVNII